MSRLLLLLAFAAVASADFVKIGFKDCKSTFKVTSVEVSDVQVKEMGGGKKLSVFKAGTTPKIRIVFEATESVATFITQVKAKIGETMLSYPMADHNACKSGTGLTCPLESGKTYTFVEEIEMQSTYPKEENIQVNWAMGRADGVKDVCVIFLAKISA